MLEREAKLAAGPDFHLPPLDGLIQGARAAPVETVRMETVYYDTPGLRLARWGCSLRLREGEGWTLKLPSSSDGAFLSRRELAFAGEGRRPPEAAVALLLAYVRHSSLAPVATLSTLRRRVRLSDAAGSPLAEVVDDEVAVLDGLRVASRFRQLEVELAAGASGDLLDPVLARLHKAGAGSGQALPKHLLALGRRAMEPPEVAPVEVTADSTAAQLIAATIARSVAELLRLDPGVRLNDDPEDVHRARVTLRSLRSQLRTFTPLLERAWAKSMQDELRWLGAALGAVRDRQVMRLRLQARAGELAPEEVLLLNGLSRDLDVETEEARSRLLLDMRSDRYLVLLDRLVEASVAPRLLPEADQPAAAVIPALARADWRRLRLGVRRLPSRPRDSELHRIRILAKRARYAAEAAAPVVGKKAARFARKAAGLQAGLGEHQDAVDLRRWLRESVEGRPAFLAGQIYLREGEAARAVRKAWKRKWKRLDRKRLRGWMI
ncbi:MAG: CYTH and CHAD domain-containing protein [Chloroflexi bacterium]|nr:MAG: CYTH and CHAD domain-containing protein [Chloroflexota bacterium]